MRVAILSTFPPRHCGIATFAADLHGALSAAPGIDDVEVIAISDADAHVDAPPVVATVTKGVRGDYSRAARLLGRLGVDVVVIQHEYGIFGGADGGYLLSFTAELSIPYVVTLHTVLTEPTDGQSRVLAELARRAAALTVFTESDRGLLVDRGVAPQAKVHVVPHGAPPEISAIASHDARRPMPIAGQPGSGPASTNGRFVIATFGLISRGKGLEVAIEAVGRLVERHPEILLVIAGRTHPEVERREGEEYRLGLLRLVRELGLAHHVTFDDRFLSIVELTALLASADLFVTTYHGREQAVSGALTFALAAGLPAVSTPYRYAEDLLTGGAGQLVPFGDPDAVAAAVDEFIDDPPALATARIAARAVGAAMSWPAVGRTTEALLADVVRSERSLEAPLLDEPALPPLRLDHLTTLIDDVGIIQHATGAVPNRSSGYCVDDVARLAVVSYRLERRSNDPTWAAITRRAIAFLVHSSPDDPDGRSGMHNVMAYDRRWSDEPHEGDHVGRTIHALGELIGYGLPAAPRLATTQLLDRLVTGLDEPSPRAAALTLIGLARADPRGQRWIDLTVRLAARLTHLHDHGEGWDWFEPVLAYDNARLPQALIVTGTRLHDGDLLQSGLDSLRWLGDECGLADGLLRLPGHLGRRRGEPHPGRGDEQPIDAAALVDAEIDALRATGSALHGDRAHLAFSWFTGRNRLGIALYDAATGGCRDGLGAHEPNINEGAESTLAYFAARLALEEAGLPLVLREHTLRSGSRLPDARDGASAASARLGRPAEGVQQLADRERRDARASVGEPVGDNESSAVDQPTA